MRRIAFIVAAAPALALAQQQVVKAPIAQYWMSVETAAGMSMPGMGAMGSMMGGAMGAQAQSGRRIVLQLGSQQAASGEPRAAHDIPTVMNMGPQLPLRTPRREPAGRPERDLPEGVEKPKGRMLLYWGCGESVRPGQPVVIDFARLAEGQAPAGMTSRRIAGQAGPAFGRNRSYGDWPNPEDAKTVPANSSLRGDHAIRGNYSPEIRFALGERQDFMERVELAASGNTLRWKALPTATGYFATLFGAEGSDVVFWSSSEAQEMGGALMDYVPPAEVARLVRERVVLAPATTECVVPGEVVKKTGTPFLNFIAYGEEANFAQPPRPQDPKVAWEPQWTVKVRFKSTASLLLGEGGGEREQRAQPQSEPQSPQQQQSKPAAAPGVKEGVELLRGIFGR